MRILQQVLKLSFGIICILCTYILERFITLVLLLVFYHAVMGPKPLSELGVTLTHEHLASNFARSCEKFNYTNIILVIISLKNKNGKNFHGRLKYLKFLQ